MIPMDKTELTKKLGDNIKELRKNRGLSLTQLAKNTGIDYTQLHRIEHGKINTSIYQIFLISKTLNLPMAMLFNEM